MRRALTLAGLVSAVVLWFAVPIPIATAEDQSGIRSAAPLASMSGAVQKICSTYAPDQWRDSIVVPATLTKFNADSCRTLARATGATHLQLGCVANEGVSLGATFAVGGNAIPPAPNCGW